MPDLCQLTGTLVGPDLEPVLAGTVTLIPEAVGYLPAALVVQGDVVGTITGGVLTINPVIILDELTYRVAFRELVTSGGPVRLRDFSAQLPVGSIDLVDLLPTQPDGGTRVIVDGTVAARAEAAADRAEAAAAAADAPTLGEIRTTLIEPHINADEPHPAYDDMSSLSLQYRARKASA